MAPFFFVTMFAPGPKHILDRKWIKEHQLKDEDDDSEERKPLREDDTEAGGSATHAGGHVATIARHGSRASLTSADVRGGGFTTSR